jgi:hypothetical protein
MRDEHITQSHGWGHEVNTATDGSTPRTRNARSRGLTWVDGRRAFAAGKLLVGAVSVSTAVSVLSIGGITTASAATAPSGPAAAYIVQASAGQASTARDDAIALGGSVGVDLPIVNGFTATLTASAAAALSHDANVRVVSPDYAGTTQGSAYYPATDPGSPIGLANSVGYDAYWNVGLSGQGVGVALIDSGVTPVPALSSSGKSSMGRTSLPPATSPRSAGSTPTVTARSWPASSPAAILPRERRITRTAATSSAPRPTRTS